MPPSSEGTRKGDFYAQDTTSYREIQSQPSPARSFQLKQSLVEGSFTLILAVSGGLLPLLPMLVTRIKEELKPEQEFHHSPKASNST